MPTLIYKYSCHHKEYLHNTTMSQGEQGDKAMEEKFSVCSVTSSSEYLPSKLACSLPGP